MADTWIVIGAVTSVNPAKRTLRVDAEPQHAHQFEELHAARLRLPDGNVKIVRLTGTRETAQGMLLTVAAGVTRDTVAMLRRAEVIIGPDEVRPRPEGVYVAEDFPGLEVVDESGEAVGRVTEAFAAPASFILAIATVADATVLVPVVDDVVRAIDLDAGRIIVGDLTAFAVRDVGDED